ITDFRGCTTLRFRLRGITVADNWLTLNHILLKLNSFKSKNSSILNSENVSRFHNSSNSVIKLNLRFIIVLQSAKTIGIIKICGFDAPIFNNHEKVIDVCKQILLLLRNILSNMEGELFILRRVRSDVL